MVSSLNKNTNEKIKPDVSQWMFFFIIGIIGLPLTLTLWFANIYIFQIGHHKEGEIELIPPTRWLASVMIPLIFAVSGYRHKSVNKSGAISGFLIAFFNTLSNYCFLSCLLVFFLAGSKATKFRSQEKKKIEKDFKEGGQRSWIQALCNAGMATVLSVLYILDYGSGEIAINFSSNYRASWLSVGVLGSYACSNADTLASELGSVLGGKPFLITTFKRVPIGTNGGVTLYGLFASFFGGLIIGLSYYLMLLYCVDKSLLLQSPPQWPLILIGGIAGLFGSVIDSFLGATLQYSGLEPSTGCISEHFEKGVIHISGHQILDNHAVNLLSTVFIGYLTPVLSKMFFFYV